jgi:hypothetical protein
MSTTALKTGRLAVIAALFAGAFVGGGALAGPAMASVPASPSISGSAALTPQGDLVLVVHGSGFTPGGPVHVEVDEDGVGRVSSTDVVASSREWVCDDGGLKPHCYWVGINGAVDTSLPLPPAPCGPVGAVGTVTATNSDTGAVASQRINWGGVC